MIEYKENLGRKLSNFYTSCSVDCHILFSPFLLSLKTGMDEEIDFAALANINLDDELTSLVPASSLELSAEEASRPEGLSPAGQHLSAAFGHDETLAGPSSRAGTSARRRKDNSSTSDAKSPGIMGINFMKPFSGVQKKMTRGKQIYCTHTGNQKLTDKQTASNRKDEDQNQIANLRKPEDKN
jgi:hypothetical protein